MKPHYVHCSSSRARQTERTKKNPERMKETQATLLPFLDPTALPPLSPSATAKVACCRGENGSKKKRGQEERNSLGWRPEGPHRPVEERGRTRREGRCASSSRTRKRDTCLLLSCSAPTLTVPVCTKAKSTDINLSHTNNSTSPLLSIPNSPNAPPPPSLFLHRKV